MASSFACCLALLASTGWETYSTGGFFSARATLKVQNQTLRSVASARVDSGFSNVLQPNISGPSNNHTVMRRYGLTDPGSCTC